MPASFLLRFQENCLSGYVRLGTQTMTRTRQEGADNDPGNREMSALPSLTMGTIKTGKPLETSDPDPASATMRAIPVNSAASGTKTYTFIQAEADKRDNSHAALSAIPGYARLATEAK